MTEIRVLDTYWSDHCRHTTFLTELKNVTFGEGDYRTPIESTYQQYMDDRGEIYAGRDDKFVCLMDLAIMGMKKLRAEGKLEDLEESDEINACSIVVPVTIDGVTEEWLVNFKNETHNHPTEIEPFGGAATCLGGAIRDPLSGAYLCISGHACNRRCRSYRAGILYAERQAAPEEAGARRRQRIQLYGNQIGLATGYVKEIYHPNYAAKRMEIGAVMGAAPRRAVQRLNSDPGDIIVLLWRPYRQGWLRRSHRLLQGAYRGIHRNLRSGGAEGQPAHRTQDTERLFRREEVSHIIKKCNDFGAGGVSVAIGRAGARPDIELDKVPKVRRPGRHGNCYSESQERMAVVLDPKDVDTFLGYAEEENLEAVAVATVTEEPRLVMHWRGNTIVDISRAFWIPTEPIRRPM